MFVYAGWRDFGLFSERVIDVLGKVNSIRIIKSEYEDVIETKYGR